MLYVTVDKTTMVKIEESFHTLPKNVPKFDILLALPGRVLSQVLVQGEVAQGHLDEEDVLRDLPLSRLQIHRPDLLVHKQLCQLIRSKFTEIPKL